MDRSLVTSMLCAAMLAACNTSVTQGLVSLPGPNSLAVAGRTLLIANSGSDELRALDLSKDPRAFVRAPNPIYTLSIPTGPIPRAVAAFSALDSANPGNLISSTFAFALSTVGGQVTVVPIDSLATLGSEVDGRFQRVSVAVPDTTLALAVTKPDGDGDRLVLAVTQGGSGSLWSARFPASLQAGDIPGIQPALAVQLGLSAPQVLAASPVLADLVAVGDRLTAPDGLGRAGGLALCNLSTGAVVRLDVGGPVMALAFSQAGDKLFGLLDPEACGAAAPCGGLFSASVDATDPASPVLTDPKTSQGPSTATARGLAVGPNITVTLAASTPTIDQLIIVSASDGSLYAFDGSTLLPPLDVGGDAANPTAFVVPLSNVTSSLTAASTLMLPGAMAFDPVRKLFYAAYQGGNALVELDPTTMTSGQTSIGVVVYQ